MTLPPQQRRDTLTLEAVEQIITASLQSAPRKSDAKRGTTTRTRPAELHAEALLNDLEEARSWWFTMTELDNQRLWGERRDHLFEIALRVKQLRSSMETEHGRWAASRLRGHFPDKKGVFVSPEILTETLNQIEAVYTAEAIRLQSGESNSEPSLPWTVESVAPIRTKVPPFQWFVAEHLARIYNKHFGAGGGKRGFDDESPYVAFATAALGALRITKSSGETYASLSVSSAIKDFKGGKGQRGKSDPK